jgi:catalase
VLAADGVDVAGTERFVDAMRKRGAIAEVLAHTGGGMLSGGSGGEIAVDRSFTSVASVLYDAVVVPCGPDAIETLARDGYALHFVAEAYKHLKPVGAFGAGVKLLPTAGIPEQIAEDTNVVDAHGVVTTTAAAKDLSGAFFDAFASALAKHRAWDRETDSVPA